MFTAKEKREAAEREVKMRKRVYPNWIANKRMSAEEGARQIGLMEEIASDYASRSIPDKLLDELCTAMWHARHGESEEQSVRMEREMLRRFFKDHFGDRYEPTQPTDLFDEPAK